jgi:hypothetical protein
MNRHLQENVQKSRLGSILVKGSYISEYQLENALNYQSKRHIKLGTALIELKLISRKQLNFALRKQSWTRAIAASIALACAPFNYAFASSHTDSNIQSVDTNQLAANTSLKTVYQLDLQYSIDNFDQPTRNFYFSGEHDGRFSVNKQLSDKRGIQFKLFDSDNNDISGEATYQFRPQISLFQSSSKPSVSNYSSGRIGPGINRYTNTKPAVFMLTIKGRSLFENSRNETKLWSLDKVKYGVQNSAELMFSVTKQF